MASDAGDNREQQRRELEEVRRSFEEIGRKMGLAFEPARQNGSSAVRQALPAPPASATAEPPPATAGGRLGGGRPAWALALVVACLLAGGGLGYLLHRPAAGPARPTVTSVATRTEPQPQPQPQTRPRPGAAAGAPPACLQTAQRGDQVIDLFTRNVRDQRLSLALKAYTDASQACRKEASP